MQQVIRAAFALLLCAACQPTTTQQPNASQSSDATGILKHKYWVCKPFHDALFAVNIPDTLTSLYCNELIFREKDTLLLTSCMSDASLGQLRITGHNALSITFDGDTSHHYTARLDEATGILHLTLPPDRATDYPFPTQYIADDAIATSHMDELTVALARKRLAGTYQPLAQKGQPALASVVLQPDGTQSGLGNYARYEPYVTGIGSGVISQPPRNVMYLYNPGQEGQQTALAWQLRGDTLRLWDTQNVNGADELPEYKVTRLRSTSVRQR